MSLWFSEHTVIKIIVPSPFSMLQMDFVLLELLLE